MIEDLIDMITESPGQTIATAALMFLVTYGSIRHCREIIILDRPQNNRPALYEPAKQEPKTYTTGYEGKEYLYKTQEAYCGSGINQHNRKDKDSELLMCIYEEYLMK
jgi:hypothetical protein